MWASPFGYNYYSPSTIYMLYQPAYQNSSFDAMQQASNAAIGTRGGSWQGMGGNSGVAVSGGGAPASAAGGSWGGAASGAAPALSGGGAAAGGGAAPGSGGSGRR